ncbi:hypothetical protein HYC85_025659 [Camellia sinensis]|uniref:NB-ARC domain-containing protein n=1 Tax=Camellia sinensis TaxID=4442 RepID=A0A7J7GBM8_CAMSI|nr:hypothetical protein HYC85_025659 [Camellia sinensis]
MHISPTFSISFSKSLLKSLNQTQHKNLKKQVQNLDDKRVGTQLLVDATKRNREIIGLDVDRWLITVDELAEEVKKFLDDEVKANKGKANKKINVVVGLCVEGNFSRVSYHAPLVAISSTSIGGFKGFESRRSIMNEVMEALTYDSVDMIGISGMEGVGKTTLVKEVAKKTAEINLVSQNPSLVKIKGEIAEVLAKELFARILTSKRVLVILDDVWDRLELNEIGIPVGDDHKGCIIVLPSRSDDVCNHMGTHKKITVQVLPEEESWNLFKEMAGICNDTSHIIDLHSTQKVVVKECGGLSIAIVTVGRALNGREKPLWDYAFTQLQKSIGKNIKGVDGKLSYNYLESEEAKKCFFLCSLFPEDSSIPIEDLVRYGIGLELFKGVGIVGEARNRVHAFVDDYKKSYLLMDFERYNVRQECVEKQDDVISISGSEFKILWDELLDSLRSIEVKDERNECVKMHDVICDVAISIVSREEHSYMVRCDGAMEDWPEKD